MPQCPGQDFLDKVFPPELTDAFFDAIYGGAEEGAYDICLVCRKVGESKASFAFELRQRPEKCLKCSLTYGLPGVFQRHPVLNIAGVAEALAEKFGWQKGFKWSLGQTEELDGERHAIPFILEKA